MRLNRETGEGPRQSVALHPYLARPRQGPPYGKTPAFQKKNVRTLQSAGHLFYSRNTELLRRREWTARNTGFGA
jgi:hypothetical protein